MAKRPTAQPDLFADIMPKPVAIGFADDDLRGTRVASRISQAVGLAMQESGKSRSEIAKLMSDELGYPISEDVLNAYASEARESNKITVERFMALITVTGSVKLVGFIAQPFGLVAVPERYSAIIELHQIETAEQELALRKAAVKANIGGRR